MMLPFMPYMGGKRDLLPMLRQASPRSFQNFHEPFLGGGAMALDVMDSHWKAGDHGHTYYLSDYSQDVVDAWTAVKHSPFELEAELRSYFEHHSRDQFFSIQSWDRNGLMQYRTQVERGARFIYLMFTCWGGVIRNCKQGFLRLSYGNVKAHVVSNYDFTHMHKVSEMLNALDTRIFRASYEEVLTTVDFADFIYLDPPYEVNDDSGKKLNSNYVTDGIQHDDVKQVILDATGAGAFVLLSNSNTAVTRELFKEWAQVLPKHFWRDGNGGMKEVKELMVANWRLADYLHRQQSLAA